MLKEIKKHWNKITEGWKGYVIYALAGIMLAYLINTILGFVLHTDLPVVAVASSSMTHKPVNGMVCGRMVTNYNSDFDDWWEICGDTYREFNITKSEFKKFPFPNGFQMGDVPIIKGSKVYKVGDIIVYSIKEGSVPIIHRIVAVNPDGTYQTKGDHNAGQLPYEKRVKKSQIHGKVIGVIPCIGWVKVGLMKMVGV